MRVKRAPARSYSVEFREECVALMERDKRSYQQLGEALGVSPDTLRAWYNRTMAKKKKRPGNRPEQVAAPKEESQAAKLARLERENERLRRENESLKMDKEILKKAAAFFARENE